jgi:hypothetical protein
VVVMSGELPAIAPSSEELSGVELAARAGVGIEEIQPLVTHGVLVPRQGRGAPFRAVDVMKIRVARACEEGGLPVEGIAKAIRAGHLSFAFLESWPFERWAARGPRTHAELATEVGRRSNPCSGSWRPSASLGPSPGTRSWRPSAPSPR